MFLESQTDRPIQKGSIEVICGSMFSGKTEDLIKLNTHTALAVKKEI